MKGHITTAISITAVLDRLGVGSRVRGKDARASEAPCGAAATGESWLEDVAHGLEPPTKGL